MPARNRIMLKPKCDHTMVRTTLALANVGSVRNGSGPRPIAPRTPFTAP